MHFRSDSYCPFSWQLWLTYSCTMYPALCSMETSFYSHPLAIAGFPRASDLNPRSDEQLPRDGPWRGQLWETMRACILVSMFWCQVGLFLVGVILKELTPETYGKRNCTKAATERSRPKPFCAHCRLCTVCRRCTCQLLCFWGISWLTVGGYFSYGWQTRCLHQSDQRFGDHLRFWLGLSQNWFKKKRRLRCLTCIQLQKKLIWMDVGFFSMPSTLTPCET